MRVTFGCLSRVLIFSAWMLVTFDGNFHPLAVISAYYTTFLIMMFFNIIFNKRSIIHGFKELKYWIGKNIKLSVWHQNFVSPELVLNSYFSILHYSYIDYQPMLDENQEKIKHKPSVIRQLLYFIIFFLIFLRYIREIIQDNLFIFLVQFVCADRAEPERRNENYWYLR